MSIKDVIIKRKTQKLLADIENPISNEEVDYNIKEWLSIAGKAPFHYPSHKSHYNECDGVEPWRLYVLDAKKCKELLNYLKEQGVNGGKVFQMLACCDYLVQVVWLPDGEADNFRMTYESSIKNMEHIAATSSLIQNLLLIATEQNVPNYWASGGVLREEVSYEYLSIPANQILLGSVFLFPKDLQNVKEVTGAWREKRSDLDQYSKFY